LRAGKVEAPTLNLPFRGRACQNRAARLAYT